MKKKKNEIIFTCSLKKPTSNEMSKTIREMQKVSKKFKIDDELKQILIRLEKK